MTGVLVLADSLTDRAGWERARRNGVGASDLGVLMTGGAGAWASLRREKETGKSWKGNQFTAYGREREAAIAAYVQDQYGLRPSSILFGRPDEPRHMATPDALDSKRTTLGEFKTTLHDWATEDDVPARYRWQMQWQMYVMDADRVLFAFEPHDNFVPLYAEPRTFWFERDESMITEAVKTAAEFLDGGGESIPEALLPLDELLDDLTDVRALIAPLREREKALEASIRDLLASHGEAVKFEGRSANLTWSYPAPRRQFNQTAFKEAHPDLFTEFTTRTESQPRLTITNR